MKSTRVDPISKGLSPLPADPPPSKLTVAVLGLTIVATLMTVPIFVQAHSWSGIPGDPKQPSGWPVALWVAAFLFGVPSMTLALFRRRSERLRGSNRGRKLATDAVWLAISGAFMWGWMFLLSLNASL